MYYQRRLLTDNWYSGYRGDGALEVGLTYLEDENEGLLRDGAELELWVLPLKKATLDTKMAGEAQVFLQKEFWPEFAGKDTVLKVNAVKLIQTAHTTLQLKA